MGVSWTRNDRCMVLLCPKVFRTFRLIVSIKKSLIFRDIVVRYTTVGIAVCGRQKKTNDESANNLSTSDRLVIYR